MLIKKHVVDNNLRKSGKILISEQIALAVIFYPVGMVSTNNQ